MQFTELALGISISAEALLRIIEKVVVLSGVAGSVSYNTSYRYTRLAGSQSSVRLTASLGYNQLQLQAIHVHTPTVSPLPGMHCPLSNTVQGAQSVRI